MDPLRTLERIATPPIPHHSTSDWAKQGSNWLLTAAWGYISPPYALYGTTGLCLFICNYLGTTALREGVIDTWFRRLAGWEAKIYFRYQGLPFVSPTIFHYEVRLGTATKASLWCYSETGTYKVGEWNYPHPGTDWTRCRVSWWSGSDTQGNWALVCQLEIWDGAAWVDYGNLYDTADRWTESSQNAVGLLLTGNSVLYDDTAIWGPV